MNLEHLNLPLHGYRGPADIQVPVYLIAQDLKARKLANRLNQIGCDGCFCIPELCNLVLAYAGFDDRTNELFDFYFELLDRECDKVTYKNDTPAKEAYEIYNELIVYKSNKGKHEEKEGI